MLKFRYCCAKPLSITKLNPFVLVTRSVSVGSSRAIAKVGPPQPTPATCMRRELFSAPLAFNILSSSFFALSCMLICTSIPPYSVYTYPRYKGGQLQYNKRNNKSQYLIWFYLCNIMRVYTRPIFRTGKAGLLQTKGLHRPRSENNSPLEHILGFISKINCSIIKCVM